jgi:dihydroneopterin aldolase
MRRGTTGVRDLQIECIVGIHPHERVTPQIVCVDLEFDYDFTAAARSDAIGDVVNYDAAVSETRAVIVERQFQLIETMAEVVAERLLASHPVVETIRVEVRKPAAVHGAAGSFVRITRGRP